MGGPKANPDGIYELEKVAHHYPAEVRNEFNIKVPPELLKDEKAQSRGVKKKLISQRLIRTLQQDL